MPVLNQKSIFFWSCKKRFDRSTAANMGHSQSENWKYRFWVSIIFLIYLKENIQFCMSSSMNDTFLLSILSTEAVLFFE